MDDVRRHGPCARFVPEDTGDDNRVGASRRVMGRLPSPLVIMYRCSPSDVAPRYSLAPVARVENLIGMECRRCVLPRRSS